MFFSHASFIDIPSKVEYKDEVSPFIGNLTTDTMKEKLTTFTAFRNRYYKSSYGAQSCRWLIQQIRDVADGYDHVSVNEFKHSVSFVCVNPCDPPIYISFISGINSPSLLDLKVPIRI